MTRPGTAALTSVLCTALLCGCTADGMKSFGYGAMQSANRSNCTKLPDASAINDCLRQYDRSYEDYRRQRDKEVTKD